VAVFLLPLAYWPGLDHPFSTPKILVLVCLNVILAVAWLSRKRVRTDPRPAEWIALGWVGAVSLSALVADRLSFEAILLAFLPAPLFWAVGRGLVPAVPLAHAVWLGSTCQAAIVVLQSCGADPMLLSGWRPEAFASPRMRVYGTMGNPDFVAAWCCAAVPFCWLELSRCKRCVPSQLFQWAAAAVQIAAILATGSRVFALVLPLQAAMLAFRCNRSRWVWLLGFPLAAICLYVSPTRSLAETVEGRLYLARITAASVQGPVLGSGPGSFGARFEQWQTAWLQAHRTDPAAARFAGPVDHAHNDYLEFLVEYGPIGLGVCLVLAAWIVAEAWRGRARALSSVHAGAATGALSLLVIAIVDFPFHRPAEWTLLWVCSGLLASGKHSRTQGD
jgi:O-antigen ligase